MKEITIRPLQQADWTAVSQIYADGIATGEATFETAVPSWESWDSGRMQTCRFVAQSDAGGDRWLGSPFPSFQPVCLRWRGRSERLRSASRLGKRHRQKTVASAG